MIQFCGPPIFSATYSRFTSLRGRRKGFHSRKFTPNMNSPRSPFHSGEIFVQRKAGTRGVAKELGEFLASSLNVNSGIGDFFEHLRIAFIASLSPPKDGSPDSRPQVWVSPVFGPAGFIRVHNSRTFSIDLATSLPEHDVLWSNVRAQENPDLGILALEFQSRRRYRTNGFVAKIDPATSTLYINVTEAFPNCPKYIQKRVLDPKTSHLAPTTCPNPSSGDGKAVRAEMSEADIALVTAADTFVLGSYAEGVGVDANHRGGNPGFVRVTSSTELYWPDYRGNGMFQSFGNLHSNDRAGLTFFDFETGETLQLTGRAEIVWDARDTLPVEAAAERAVRFRIDGVRRSVGPATNYRWKMAEYSPYNPVVLGAAESTSEKTFPMKVQLVKIVQDSASIKTFRFLAPFRLNFLPGQYATFEFEKEENMGSSRDYVRTWTLSESANSVGGDVTLEVSVKRKPGGVISTWLHDYAKLGLSVQLLGIGGEMTPFRDEVLPEKMLLLSGGVGITPNMAILRGIGARGAEDMDLHPDVVFMHQERHLEDMPFRSEILRRARLSKGKVRVIQLISQDVDEQAVGADETSALMRGRIGDKALALVPHIAERVVYLCGPIGFMEKATELLVSKGVDPQNIVTEEFNF